MGRSYFLVILLVLLIFGGSAVSRGFSQQGALEKSFEFGLIGDLPYTAKQEAQFLNLRKDINQAKLAFVIHDGDFKSGSTLCSDTVFSQRKKLFETFEAPFIFIPGDNEWTDCHRANNGSYDPLERLAKLRALFFQGNASLGKQTLQLTRQSKDPQFRKFPENVLWNYGDVMFVGLHIVGSNNNFGRAPEADAEYRERNRANLTWMKQAFELAKLSGSRGIMLIIQANPNFELPSTDKDRTGFNDFLAALEAETLAFKKPVVLVHRR